MVRFCRAAVVSGDFGLCCRGFGLLCQCTMPPRRKHRQQLMSSLLPLLLLLGLVRLSVAQEPDLAPGPQPELGIGGPGTSPPAPIEFRTPVSSPVAAPPPFSGIDSPAPGATPQYFAPLEAPSPVPIPSPLEGPSPYEAPAPFSDSPGPNAETGKADVTWCAVREEIDDCLTYTNILNLPTFSWTCVMRDSKRACMEALKQGDANLFSLEAGLAYLALKNYSMKAILAEEYSFHAQNYAAVALVNKQRCIENPNINLEDFRNQKSCHSGYLTASGWNYPVQAILDAGPVDRAVLNTSLPNDVKVLASFFSASCAPSELNEGGICSACGDVDENSFCSSNYNSYAGESGAFRCLMDGSGDIAFLRAKTPTLYSKDGRNSQTWSTKNVDEFMYLCPSGGCKQVNDNFGSCQFATIPANVLMVPNSLPESLRGRIIRTLLAANWTDSLYTGRNAQNHLLSVSTQGLAPVTKLTRQYLGTSADVTQTIFDLQSDKIHLTVASIAVMSSVPHSSLSVALAAFGIGLLGVFDGLF